jgi:hypothetical protein
MHGTFKNIEKFFTGGPEGGLFAEKEPSGN